MSQLERRVGFVIAVGALLAINQGSAAAADPEFKFEKPKEVKEKEEVEWKASAQLGFILTTGNSNVTTVSGGANASRHDGKNKIALEAAGAYAESTILTANDVDMDGTIDNEGEIGNESKVTAANFLGKFRYDRFFTLNNSLYITAFAGLDHPASKDLMAGGQIGYARQLVRTKMHELAVEAGYDFTYVSYITPVDSDVFLHSARIFLGYNLTLSENTNLGLSGEALINLNKATIGGRDVGIAEATRVNAKLWLTTKLYKMISFRFAFSARYDNAPSLRPALSIPYAASFTPFASNLDTTTEVGIIVSFL